MKLYSTLFTIFVASVMGMSLLAQTPVSLNNKTRISAGGGNVNDAFDKSRNTTYQANDASHAWVGLDLGTPHIITQVRWRNAEGTYSFSDWYPDWCLGGGPRSTTLGHSQLAVFEGANERDFSDALPLYLVTDESTNMAWHDAAVNVTRAFRYVRYMGAANSHSKVVDVEFSGYEYQASAPVEGETPVEQFYQPTNLPVVVVHTANTLNDDGSVRVQAGTDPWDKTAESDLTAMFTFLSQEGAKILSQSGTFRERGNSSRNFPKRPYRVKLDTKQKPFSAETKFKKWTLVPAIDDRTLMRNMIGYGVNEKMGQEYSPYIRPVDLFVNGEYKGVYQFCDQVEASKDGRIQMDVIKSTKNAETGEVSWPASAYDFGWFLELDALSDGEPWRFDSKRVTDEKSPFVPVTIKSPDEDDVPENLKTDYINTIKNYFDKMLDAANNGKVHEYLDLESFARHFLACEFTGNTDSYRSLYMYKRPGNDKFFAGPIWDLNLAFNNDYRIGNLNQRKSWSYTNSTWANEPGIKLMMEQIMNNNPAVINEVKNQWAMARTNLTAETLLSEVDYWEEKLDASQELNFTRWQNLGFKFFFQQQATGNWYDDVDYLRECLEGRMIWMDQMLGVGQKNFNLTISAGWATVYLPIAFNVPNGLTFYEVAGAQDGVLDLVEVKTTQPNRPYLVKGKNGTYSLKGSEVEVVDGQELGVLVGTAVEIPQAPVGSYVLQNHDGLVNFYKVGSTRPKIGAQRAYMVLPAGQQAPDRFYLDGEETGLDEMAMDEVDVTVRIYDMAGHLLEEIAEGQWSDEEVLSKYGRGMYVIRSGNTTRKVAYGY